eukprot:GHVS01073856.1.p1 GENE.GHVS01073856.1~~GHVS01073856.1.p1  ORF type:complete len:584 (-),score=89.74 GHVS01073856.1:570-2279(-)
MHRQLLLCASRPPSTFASQTHYAQTILTTTSPASTASSVGAGRERGDGLVSFRSPFAARPSAVLHAHKRTFAAHVVLSKARHDELLLAEITEFSLRPTRPLSLQRILSNPNPTEFLHKELPVRFASRIKQLETLPYFHRDTHILHCKNIYTESFKQLRTCNWEEEADFTKILTNLKRRHANIVPILVTGVRNLQQRYPEEFDTAYIDTFMNNFFLSRIGTEMLTSQYLAKVHSLKVDGIIDQYCDPMVVLKKAAEDAEKICYHQYQCCPKIVIWNRDVHQFPYIPQYLYYILFELLKNAMRAVIEHHNPSLAEHCCPVPQATTALSPNLTCPPASPSDSIPLWPRGDLPVFGGNEASPAPGAYNSFAPAGASNGSAGFADVLECPGAPAQNETLRESAKMSPIQSTLSGDEQEVAIKIADQGGGVPRESISKVWSYLYTTAQSVEVEQFRSPTIESTKEYENVVRGNMGMLDAVAANALPKGNVSPLAGFGCGLPLSRLYASYLGGSLQLVSMPLYGTDAYLFLNKIGDTEELIPPLYGGRSFTGSKAKAPPLASSLSIGIGSMELERF